MKKLPVPLDKLRTFRQWLGLSDAGLKNLEALRDVFTKHKEDFARYFHAYFMKIPQARFIIEHEGTEGYLLRAWAHWFEALFSRGLDEEFLGYLWRVGVRHVEVGLDQRFSNTGFSVVRQFCQGIVLSELAPEDVAEALCLVDQVIDFCILVETDAYLETSTRCDLEIIKGVADRIRNPVAVIGGNVGRLLRKADIRDPVYPIYEFIFSQSSKCERLVRDISTYVEVFEREPSFTKIPLESLLKEIIEDLLAGGKHERPHIEMKIAQDASSLMADPRDMRALFRHLLENGLEALEGATRIITISSTVEGAPPHSALIEIVNTGKAVREDDLEKLFSPFYTTKAEGTGFGLPIAAEAARNNLGRIRLEPAKGKGTRVVLTLPLFEQLSPGIGSQA